MDVDWKKEEGAPSPGTPVCDLHDLVPGRLSKFDFGTDKVFSLIVYRTDDGIFGYVNRCPHHWIAMNRENGEFIMWDEDEHELMCAHHTAVFRLAHGGECIDGPCKGSNLTSVPLAEINGQLVIDDSVN